MPVTCELREGRQSTSAFCTNVGLNFYQQNEFLSTLYFSQHDSMMKILKAGWHYLTKRSLANSGQANRPRPLSVTSPDLNSFNVINFYQQRIFYQHGSMKIVKPEWQSARLQNSERAASSWTLSRMRDLISFNTLNFYQQQWISINSNGFPPTGLMKISRETFTGKLSHIKPIIVTATYRKL